MTGAMSTYRLRIVPWRDRSCVRVIDFRGDDTLGGVHRAIQDVLSLDDDHCWAFYLSGDFGDRETEYRGSPEGPLTRWPARLAGLDLVPGMWIAYVYDFGDNLRHDIEVLEVGSRDPALKYPRLVEQQGTPPPQYHWPEAAEGEEEEPRTPAVPESLRQLCEPFADAWSRWADGNEDSSKIDADLALAHRVLETCKNTEGIESLSSLAEASVDIWIGDVAGELVHARRMEDAIGLLRALLAAAPRLGHGLTLARVLSLAGRSQEALDLLDAAAPSEPGGADRLAVVRAELTLAVGRVAEGEQSLRGLLAKRWLSGKVRGSVAAALIRLLTDTGRKAEATQLRAAEADRLVQRTHPNPPERRDGPKVGRNDPCGCGSGKKHKKCCGR